MHALRCGWLYATLATAAGAVQVSLEAPTDLPPVAFGVADLRAALTEAGHTVTDRSPALGWRIVARVTGAGPAESFELVPGAAERRIEVFGGDATGAMYGLLELAERIAMGTPLDRLRPVRQQPYLEFRAPNPFFSLPHPDVADWSGWWFRDDDFWRTYLDQLARARWNWVDLHGMLHLRGAWSFPNLLPYFVDSPSFPEVGLADDEKARNLAQLNRVIGLAADRGIKLALMSYTTSWNVPGAPRPTYPETEENLALYTREAVAELLRRCPGLGRIGFRIGESGKSEGFFRRSYLPGVVDSGVDIPIYSRSWLSSKPKILELAAAYPGRLDIEIKYNGEHYGLPYPVAGGRMAGWHSYSYQDYCQPPRPYGILWQNRFSGTHRLWRWGDPEWVARTVRSYRFGDGLGFSLEPPNAYRLQDDYYHRDPSLRWFDWIHQRDWFWYVLWGRLSYDPTVGDAVWRHHLGRRFGAQRAAAMLDVSRRMSRVIALIYAAHCQGPDHLNMAPELETGGSLATFVTVPPLDTLAMQSIPEYTTRLLSGSLSARTTPRQMAAAIEQAIADATAAFPAGDGAELADWRADVDCLRRMGRYYAAKIRAACDLELFRATADPVHLAAAQAGAEQAVESWRSLADLTDRLYVPFLETMRPRTERFTWSALTPEVEADLAVPDQVAAEVRAAGTPLRPGVRHRDLARVRLEVSSRVDDGPAGRRLTVRATPTTPLSGGRASLRLKPVASETVWRRIPMAPDGGGFTATVDLTPAGALWCVEVTSPVAGGCWPDWRYETPYRVVPAWGATVSPAAPAWPDLTRADLSRRAYSAIVCGRVAGRLAAAPPEHKRALLAAVAAGQTLILFNQDYPAFDPSWLPGGIQGSDADHDAYRPLGPHPILDGLPATVRAPKIVNDALSGGDAAWRRLTEPWGLALRRHGQGALIVCQLRLEETMSQRESARLLTSLVAYARAGSRRPLLLLDSGDGQVPAALELIGQDDWITLP